jgi:2-C-methyl-D-erythritol 2,4-cyclodiphosphate synthase
LYEDRRVIASENPFHSFRIGFGTDLHCLEPGDGVMLGGVKIPCGYQCHAVSDGDVVLHALVDALLGCAALGDIGEHSPEHAVIKGESSRRFVEAALAMLADAGFAPINVDCVIDLEHVRLAESKAAIRTGVARLLRLDESRVNIKAKTAEGLGPVGEGKAVAAQVVALAGTLRPEDE